MEIQWKASSEATRYFWSCHHPFASTVLFQGSLVFTHSNSLLSAAVHDPGFLRIRFGCVLSKMKSLASLCTLHISLSISRNPLHSMPKSCPSFEGEIMILRILRVNGKVQGLPTHHGLESQLLGSFLGVLWNPPHYSHATESLKKGVDHTRWVGSMFNKQGNLLLKLVLGSHKTIRFPTGMSEP